MTVSIDVAGLQWVLPEKLLIRLAQSPSSSPEAIRKCTKGVHFRGLSKIDAAQVCCCCQGNLHPALPMQTTVVHSYTHHACLIQLLLTPCSYEHYCMPKISQTATQFLIEAQDGGHDDTTYYVR